MLYPDDLAISSSIWNPKSHCGSGAIQGLRCTCIASRSQVPNSEQGLSYAMHPEERFGQ